MPTAPALDDRIVRVGKLRRCPCGALVVWAGEAPVTCDRCGRLYACPPLAEWPRELVEHQAVVRRDRILARHATPEDGYRFLLLNNYRGTWQEFGGAKILLPFFGCSLHDVYPIALERALAWAASRADATTLSLPDPTHGH